MSDSELITTHLQHLTTFRGSVAALNSSSQPLPQIQTQWTTLRQALSSTVLPKLGAAIQLAARGMMALVTSGLEGIPAWDQLPNNTGNFVRPSWVKLINGQLEELEQLLRDPPELLPTLIPASQNPTATPADLAAAREILANAQAQASSNVSAIRGASAWALGVGIIAVLAASAVPFVWRPDGTLGWPLAAAWAARVLMVAALLVGAIQLFNVFRDLARRAAGAKREEASLKVLAASTYLAVGREQAFVDLVRGLTQPDRDEKAQSEALVIPSGLVKELPELLKLFKPEK